jgi:hypothetical protein
MRPAYQRDTPICDAMAELDIPASLDRIFSEYTSAVSQAGWLDASQAEHA